MKKKIVSGTMFSLLVCMLLASFAIWKASAGPSVRIYVAEAYTTEIHGNQTLRVMINIESPTEWRSSPNGIIGWSFDASVDPEILEPMTVESSTDGYFIYDFTVECEHEVEPGFRSATLFEPEKEAGLFRDVAEFVAGYGKLGIGAGGNGMLCELLYRCKTEVSSFQMDIYDANYWTPDGVKHSCDIVEDGEYNVQHFLETNDASFRSTHNDAESESDITKGESGIVVNGDLFFILTAIVFIATTAYLAIRKPKIKTELKTS